MRVFLFGLLALFFTSAHAIQPTEQRVAWVIGNSAYSKTGQLSHATSDAKDMADTLRKLGFKTKLSLDVTQSQFRADLGEFQEMIKKDAVAVVFYSGHGWQVGGTNYLMATDAEHNNDSNIRRTGLPLDMIVDSMTDGGARANIVFLDACRSHPPTYVASSRGAADGLAKLEKAEGTLVIYAAQPGSPAADGNESQRNSPFTTALKKALVTPDLNAEQVAKFVSAEVKATTRGLQKPDSSGILNGDFIFMPGSGQKVVINMPSSPAGESGNTGRKTSEDCLREAAVKRVSPNDQYEFMQACLAGREFTPVIPPEIKAMQERVYSQYFPNATRPVTMEDAQRAAKLRTRYRGLGLDVVSGVPMENRAALTVNLRAGQEQMEKLIRAARLDEAEKILADLEVEYRNRR